MWSSSSTGKSLYQPDTPNKGVIEMIVARTATADLAPPTVWRRLAASRIDDQPRDSSQPLCRHRARRAHAFRKGARSG